MRWKDSIWQDYLTNHGDHVCKPIMVTNQNDISLVQWIKNCQRQDCHCLLPPLLKFTWAWRDTPILCFIPRSWAGYKVMSSKHRYKLSISGEAGANTRRGMAFSRRSKKKTDAVSVGETRCSKSLQDKIQIFFYENAKHFSDNSDSAVVIWANARKMRLSGGMRVKLNLRHNSVLTRLTL